MTLDFPNQMITKSADEGNRVKVALFARLLTISHKTPCMTKKKRRGLMTIEKIMMHIATLSRVTAKRFVSIKEFS